MKVLPSDPCWDLKGGFMFMMRKDAIVPVVFIRLAQLTVAFIIFGTLPFLIGCGGMAGSSGSTPPIEKAGTLSLGTTTVSFGSIHTGSSKVLTVTVKNSGSAALTISKLSLSNSSFKVNAPTLPLTLNVDESSTISIQFTPTAAGSFNADLTITSDASNPAVTVSLSGTGASTAGTLTVTPATISIGSVAVGSSKAISGTLSASGASVKVTAVSTNNSSFTVSGLSLPVTIAAGASVPFKVTFSPKSTGAASASLDITSDASSTSVKETLSGTGTSVAGTLAMSPGSVNLGNVVVGNSKTVTGTLSVSGGSVTITDISTSNSSVFTVSGLSLPVTIAAGSTVTFKITFSPKSAGSANATLDIASNSSSPTTESLLGTGTPGTGTLAITPGTFNLGSVVVGSSSTVSGTLSASGASVTITGATTNDSGVFTVGGLSLPATIQAGSSVAFNVTFSPKSAGAATASLDITSNASTSSITEALGGTGTATPTYSVNLSWDASSSAQIAGYNIYRAVYSTSCGAFSRVNSVLSTSTTYTDGTVTSGTAYCYAATAVNTNNQESGYSNIVSDLLIPTS